MARTRWDGFSDDEFASAEPWAGELDPDEPEVEGALLAGPVLAHSEAPGIRIADTLGRAPDLAGVAWSGARLDRVELRDARLTGADLTEARFRAVRLRRCRIDGVVLAGAHLVDVRLEGCDLTGSILTGTVMERVAFVDCDLTGVDLDGSRLDRVDLRTSRIVRVARTPALRGAIVDAEQVIALAGRLAEQAGLVVRPDRAEDPDPPW